MMRRGSLLELPPGPLHERLAALGFAPGTPEHQELFEQVVRESKNIGTHQGNLGRKRAVNAAHKAGDGHDLRRSRTTRARDLVDKEQRRFIRTTTRAVEDFDDERTDEKTLRTKMREALRRLYLYNFLHGLKTGTHLAHDDDLWKEVSEKDLVWVRKAFKHEAKYLDKFIDDIVGGISKAERDKRIRNYSRASEGAFDAARVLSLPSDSLVQWRLDAAAETCPSCILLQRNSPYPPDMLPTQPRAGATICLHMCKCSLRVVTATAAEVQAARRRLGSAKHILDQLHRAKRR